MSTKFTITARENGPYLIAGQAEYTDAQGNVHKSEGKMIALCRCGQSSNKPFCDGSHKQAGFTAPTLTLEIEAS